MKAFKQALIEIKSILSQPRSAWEGLTINQETICLSEKSLNFFSAFSHFLKPISNSLLAIFQSGFLCFEPFRQKFTLWRFTAT